MNRLTLNPLLFVVGVLSAHLTLSAETASSRVQAFAALPVWTGLWETEAAAQLLRTGKFGSTALQQTPPYNTEWEKKAARVPALPTTQKDPLAADSKVCAPGGFPTAMAQPVPDAVFEFLVTPEQTLFVTSDRTIRHIYTDGRRHPAGPDLWPTIEGHSIGHWEGQTLVVDTVARTAGPVTNVPGSANLSRDAHFRERIWLLSPDTLLNEMTIEDPERLARPWSIVIRYHRIRDMTRMIAVDCFENDRNPVIDGKIVIAPPR
jgi:hypothetical protein